jgi:uncharacterized protein YjbI with pentapeptide repeats
MARTPFPPRRAVFPPYVALGDDDRPRLLEDVVHARLRHRRPLPLICVSGSSAALRVALEHLAHVFVEEERLLLVGGVPEEEAEAAPRDPSLLLCGTAARSDVVPPECCAVLLPVSPSAVSDYLLDRHGPKAARALEKLRREPLSELVREDPELCAAMLEMLVGTGHCIGPEPHALVDLRLRASGILDRLRGASQLEDLDFEGSPELIEELRKLVRDEPELRSLPASLLRERRGPLGALLGVACALEPGFHPPLELLLPLEDLYLADIDLCGWELGGNVLRCDLSRARLRAIRACDLLFIHSRLLHADLREADLEGAVIDLCNLAAADLRSARLVELHSSQTIWCEARLEHAALRDATLLEARFDRARLAESALEGALFCDSALVCAVLDGAHAEGASFTRCELRGALARGTHARRAAFQDCDLAGSDWSGADLHGASFVRVRCRDAKLGPADFRGARLDQRTAEELRSKGAWV